MEDWTNVIEAALDLGCSIYREPYRDKRTGERRACQTWAGRFTRQTTDGKRPYAGGFKSPREALIWYLAQIDKPTVGPSLPEGARLTCGEWLDQWLPVKKRQVSFNTYRPYESHVRLYLKPSFADILLHELDTATIATAVDTWLTQPRQDGAEPVMPQTVCSILGTLTTCLHDARRRKLISENPASAVARPKFDRDEPTALPLEVAREYIAACASEGAVGLAVAFAIATGWRRSEVLGLRFGQIDLDSQRAKMTSALERVKLDDGTHITRSKSPKTKKSRRLQKLPSIIVDLLRHHRRVAAKRHLADGRGHLHDTDFVFEDERKPGEPIAPNTFTSRYFRLISRLRLPRYTFHDLRRTFGVTLLEEGVGIDQVSRAMGHADVRMTSDRYTGVVESLEEDAAERLDHALRYGRRGRKHA